MVETWLSMYEAPDPATAPKLALEKDEEWKKKRDAHLEKLRRPYDRRDSLLGLRLEEERHEIESMSPADALAALEAMKDEKSFPKWMWDEIVRLTDLRIKEVKQGPVIAGTSATMSVSLTHAELGGPSVVWEFQFEQAPDGVWRATSHHD
jgi:hypothetical protein